jgi:hypothetical protein
MPHPIAGALRQIGIPHVDELGLDSAEGWPDAGRWSVAIVPSRSAALLGPSALQWLLSRCGCVHVEETCDRPGAACAALGGEWSPCPVPGRVRWSQERVVDAMNHLLQGYVDPTAVELEPISYDGVPASLADGTERSGVLREGDGLECWLRRDDGGNSACAASRGRLLVSRVPLLRALLEGFLVPEVGAPIRRFGGCRSREALEIGLLHAWACIAGRHGLPLVTREPWPEGVSHVLSLRLDYDRPVPGPAWEAFLAWQRRIGLRASWYFLGATVDSSRMAQLAAEGHELALHYRRVDVHGASDIGRVRQAVESAGARLVGATCHGGNYQAATDLRWLAESGLAYSEQLGRCSFLPYHGLMQDGSWSRMLMAARHVSVDVSLTPPRADLTYMLRTHQSRRRMQGHTVVMNHPDINFAETREAVDRCGGAGTEYWTQAEALSWRRASHSDARSDCAHGTGTETIFRQRHGAARQPVVRIWSDVDCADATFGEGPLGPYALVAKDEFAFRPVGSGGS